MFCLLWRTPKRQFVVLLCLILKDVIVCLINIYFFVMTSFQSKSLFHVLLTYHIMSPINYGYINFYFDLSIDTRTPGRKKFLAKLENPQKLETFQISFSEVKWIEILADTDGTFKRMISFVASSLAIKLVSLFSVYKLFLFVGIYKLMVKYFYLIYMF